MTPSDAPDGLAHSPLHDRHLALGARMSPFSGWLMPVDYGSVRDEHDAVRGGAGLFDVSHLGTATVTGPDSVTALSQVVTNDPRRVGEGRAQYTLLCDHEGRVVDDLMVYVLAEDDVLLVPNAANCAAVVSRLQDGVTAEGAVVRSTHGTSGILAVQGPASREVLLRSGFSGADLLAYMDVVRGHVAGVPAVVARTGYTGEVGFEVIVEGDRAGDVWDALLDTGLGLRPCGLGARDTLRTEMAYPLHGQDLGGDIGPLEAGLGWAVAWDTDFVGKDALVAARTRGPAWRVRTLPLTGRGIPRPGMDVKADADGSPIGRVTSGTFSPTLGQGLALVLVPADLPLGTEVVVDVRGRPVAGRLASGSAVESHVRD